MTLNKTLQRENDRLKKDLEDMRDSDILTFLWSWDMFQENRLLWELIEGMICSVNTKGWPKKDLKDFPINRMDGLPSADDGWPEG